MIALLLALLFPWAPHAFAQSSDQRLSPQRFIADIDIDMEVQAAARNGDRVLVVWGSSRRGADSALEGALWWQFIEAGEGVGDAQVVPDATPSRFVSVIPVHDRFIIVWNDLRNDAPTLFCRLLDMDGTLSEQTSLWNGEVSDAGVTAIAVAGGYRIFWSGNGEDVLRVGTIDSNGLLIGETEELGQGAAGRFIEPVALPGYRIIERQGALPLLIDNAGNEHPLGAAATKFAFPYAIGSDGSIVTIAVDTVRLYRSMLDITPTQSTVVSYHPAWIRGSSVVQFDSLGRIVVLYATGGGAAAGRAERVYISMHALRTAASDNLFFVSRYVHSRHTIAAPSLACEYFTLETDRPDVVQGIGGHHLLRVPVRGSRVSTCLGEPVVETIDRVEQIVPGTGGEPFMTSLPMSLPEPVMVPVERVNRPRQSVVMAMLNGDSIILAAPSAELHELRTERFPGITMIAGRPMVGWRSTGVDTLGMLIEWKPGGSERVVHPPVDLGALSIDREFHDPPSTITRLRPFSGGFILATDFTWNRPGSYRETPLYRRRYLLMLPTLQGWRSVVDMDASAVNPHLFAAARNFDNDETVIAWTLSARNSPTYALKVHINAYDTAGRPTWDLDSLPMRVRDPFWIVPVGQGEFVYTDLESEGRGDWWRFTRVRDGEIVAHTSAQDDRRGQAVNLRLPYIITYRPGPEYMDLTLYDTTGKELARDEWVPRRSMPYHICVVQDPADSTIMVIWGARGVRMARYDRTLKQIGSDRIISDTRDSVMNVAALVHNDSLFVVWEDYRDSLPAIYGRAIRLREHSVAESRSPVMTGAPITFSPNPVGDKGVMGFVSPVGDAATVEILDVLGRLCFRLNVPPGARTLMVPVDRLTTGLYNARLIDGERTGTISFMVTR